MNIFDMNKNSLPEQVQTNKDNIEYLMTNASEFSCVLRAAIAPTFNIDNNYNVGDANDIDLHTSSISDDDILISDIWDDAFSFLIKMNLFNLSDVSFT